MKLGYARYTRAGSKPEAQDAALVKAGVRPTRIHSDDHRPKRSTRPGMEGLDEAISHVRQGDVLVVENASRLGRSRDEVLDSLRRVAERGGSVEDASACQVVGWAPEVAAALAFADRAVEQLGRERLTPARRASGAANGAKFGNLSTAKRERVRAMWHNVAEHTVAAVEAESGIKRRALYLALGPRRKGDVQQ